MVIEFFADTNVDGQEEFVVPIKGEFAQSEIDRIVESLRDAVTAQSDAREVSVKFGIRVDGTSVHEVEPANFRNNDVAVVASMVTDTLLSIHDRQPE